MAALTINVSTVNPLGDRVFVKVSASEEKTAGGILLPDTAKEKPQIGEIAAVGPGKLNDKGERTALEVKVGDSMPVLTSSSTAKTTCCCLRKTSSRLLPKQSSQFTVRSCLAEDAAWTP